MNKFAGTLLGGLAVGLIAGAAITISTPERDRRRLVKGGKRAIRRCGDIIEDWL